MDTRLLFAAAASVLALTGIAANQTSARAEDMAHMMMQAPEGASDATKAYVVAMNTMSMSMSAEFTNDADIDFLAGMVPHHQGAVDAARIVLQYGKDPEVKAYAEQVIAAQEAEIIWMQGWLAAHGQ